ncbi:MAG: hypothetical protein AAGA25_03985 [Planctomycetota bacterium]
MKTRVEMLWMTRIAVAGLLAWPSAMASGQLSVEADGEELATGRSQTVVVTQRPLRTFRGETVRIGRYATSEKAIGVVRPLRPVPGTYYGDYRYGYDRYYPRYEKEIGVVRPYVTYNPPVYNPPQTFTNPNARDESGAASANVRPSAIDLQPVLPEDVEVTAIETVVVPEAHRDDPWALLNHGYYREARQQFALLGTVNDIPTRTGHALAAVLSGDLPGGMALMPDTPELLEGTTFRPATMKRLDQMREYLYADEPEMQAKLQAVLGAAQTPIVSVE